jgi:hypothetical protein
MIDECRPQCAQGITQDAAAAVLVDGVSVDGANVHLGTAEKRADISVGDVPRV